MHVGLTGTRWGMTPAQEDAVGLLLLDKRFEWLHHGMCKGSDAQAHWLGLERGLLIEGHPPTDRKLIEEGLTCNTLREPLPYLQRNRAIVDASNEMIATPEGYTEVLRSGTWATVRYARSIGRVITMVWPDGLQARYGHMRNIL